jgi:hypothetical protein
VANKIGGTGAANVDYTPWLNVGTDTDLGTPGFQGDFSVLNVDDDSPQSGAVGRITEAYNDLTLAGKINVLGGTYTENVDPTAGPDKDVTLSPGASSAQVIINGNLTMDAGDTLAIEVAGTNSLTQYDNLVVNGIVTLGGATLTLTDLGIVDPPFGTVLTIIKNDDTGAADPVIGTFAGLPAGSIVMIGTKNYTLFYGGDDGNDVILVRGTINDGLAPITYAEDTAWNALPLGMTIDGDLFTPGTQTAMLGFTAFGTATNPPAGTAAIQKAVNAATAGGTVIVNDGAYAENTVIPKDLTLEGRPPNGLSNATIAPVGGIGLSVMNASMVTIRDINVAVDGGETALVVDMPGAGSTLVLDNFKSSGSGSGGTIGNAGGGPDTVNVLTSDNAGTPDTINVSGSILSTNLMLQVTHQNVGTLNIQARDGNDTINASPATNAQGTLININGGLPNGVGLPNGNTAGDTLNLDMTVAGTSSAVIVATIPGIATSGTTKTLTFTQIETIHLTDDSLLTNVEMGDLYIRGSTAVDIVQFSGQGDPNLSRTRVNNTMGYYTVTRRAVVYGRDGNDIITQGNFNHEAEFYGEGGDDQLTGFNLADLLVGGLGNDRINPGQGNNVVWGDDLDDQDGSTGGVDTISTLDGNDIIYGGAGNDPINAGGGDDYVYGGRGNDNLTGGNGNDRLYGGLGNDILSGDAGNDLLSGGDDNDTLYGKTGNDVLIGGNGADWLTGDDGNDLLFDGRVTYSLPASGSEDSHTAGDASDTAMLKLLQDWSTSGILTGSLTLNQDGVNDQLRGGLNNDKFYAEKTAEIYDFVLGQDTKVVNPGP